MALNSISLKTKIFCLLFVKREPGFLEYVINRRRYICKYVYKFLHGKNDYYQTDIKITQNVAYG